MRHVQNVTTLTVITANCATNVSVKGIVQVVVSVKMTRNCVAFVTTVTSAAGLVPKVLPAVPACSVIWNTVRHVRTVVPVLSVAVTLLTVRNVTPVQNV